MLDRTHKDAVRTGAKEQLLALAYGLISTAEEQGDGLSFRKALGEPRLGQPDSGLYAFVERADGSIVWRSPSMLASGVDATCTPEAASLPPVSRSSNGRTRPAGADRFVMAYTVIWETLGATEVTFWVLADRAPVPATRFWSSAATAPSDWRAPPSSSS